MALAAGSNAFGFDLWAELSTATPGNLALSPASLSLALGMTYAGAHGATADAMRKTLHLDGVADPHAAAGLALARWTGEGRPYALRVANRLFGEATATFAGPFLDLMKTAYGAPLEPVDFLHAADAARVHINDWVAGRTEDRIKDLLPGGALDEDTRLVLANAIYFKGAWLARFDEARTRDGVFHAPGGDVTVPFMRQAGAFLLGGDERARVLELPYVGGDLAMDIVLPNADLAAMGPLDAARLEALVRSLRPSDHLDLGLPRFRVETASLALRPALSALGMGAAFTPGADFTGMAAERPLFISDAFHKVFVEVNEEGTEAAAATAVVMTRESARVPDAFEVDRPFLFVIRDVKTGHVLFMGRVVTPAPAA